MNSASTAGGGELREELRGDAQTVTDSAKQRFASEVDARKGSAVTQAQSLSTALDAAAGELSDSPDWMRSLFQKGARSLQQFAQTIENKDSRQLTRDVQQIARDNPALFLAGAAAAGFAAARVLKAGVEDTSGSATGSYADQSGPEATLGQSYDPYLAGADGTSGSAFSTTSDAELRPVPEMQGEF